MKKILIIILCALFSSTIMANWSGTGFALKNGYIATNYHVVENAKTLIVKGIKGDNNTEYYAKVVVSDKQNDIAIIKIEDDDFKGFGMPPYKIKRSIAEVGEYVWTLGYPLVGVLGNEIKFTDGKISSRTGVHGDISTYQISAPIQPGNSGGPLFDKYGNIIGITSSGLNRERYNSENVNYAIKTSYLYNLIESTLSTDIIPQGTSLQNLSLEQQIKSVKNYVYTIVCSDEIITDTYETHNGWIYPNDWSRSVFNDGTIQIDKPPYYLLDKNLRPDLVMIHPKHTIVVLVWNNYENKKTEININPDAYISVFMDNPKGKKYKLLNAEHIAIKPETTTVPLNDERVFVLYFERIPDWSTEIILRSEEFNLWGIKLK